MEKTGSLAYQYDSVTVFVVEQPILVPTLAFWEDSLIIASRERYAKRRNERSR